MDVTKKSQRVCDVSANTVIVKAKSIRTVNDTVFMNITQTWDNVKFPQVLKLSDQDINTIKNVTALFHKNHNTETCNRVAHKVMEVLEITTDMYAIDFLEKLMEDYIYLATKESKF